MKNIKILMGVIAFYFAFSPMYAQSIEAIGALEFNPEGVLFVGDNVSGSIHAIDLREESSTKESFEINADNIDVQVAAVLGTAPQNILINDIAVHPNSGEVYLSVTRGHGVEAMPALIKVKADNELQNVDLKLLKTFSCIN